ncbi:helix-turn-helix transcriptional regulator [Bacillus sp. FJAT-49736]|uniref:helix-turn-helix domain-containing protein n=1 Tax=Bacillus sp. FJAT-49736 TaxID=2833582 RepID=UPI001BC8EAEC|nr:helix-turn-helix transcriptional regulator [Bacillus sp. FJAT-49736]MBS4172079.1 helix-turn-helix transcriptional regulator [Bacillus sp. FJAT-49736]
MEINEIVKFLRNSKGISQTFLAKKLKLSVSGYNMKERGKRPITIKELEKIAIILEVPVSIFFDEKFHVKCKSIKSKVVS